MTIITEFTGTENYAERMAGLEAIHDWWFGTGSFASAATLGQVRANLNTILVGTTILNRETFATWLSKINTLIEPSQYVAGLLFGEGQAGALWQGTLPSSMHAAHTGNVDASIGGTVGEIEDQSGNGLHLTQASTSLRPVRGRRPKTGARNILVPWNSLLAWAETASSFVSGANARVVTANAAANPIDGAMNATKIAASDTSSQQRLYTTILGARTGNRLTLSCHLKAAGLTHANLRTTSMSGVSFNLATGVATNLSGPNAESWNMEDLGDGWYRCHVVLITSALEVIWLQLASGANNSGFAGNGTDGVYAYGFQAENFGHVTPLQQVNGSLLDITESGVGSVSYAAFDLVDDVLTTGAIAGGITGQAFVAGDGGCYVSDLAVPSGGTFTIGGTSHNWTGAARGILRSVSDGTGRVLDAMIRAGAYTEDEIARLERYYRALGGKGLLVPGSELVVNGTFDADLTGWLHAAPSRGEMAWESGTLKLDNSGTPESGNYAQQTLTTVAGAHYRLDAVVTACAAVIPRVFFGALPGSSALGVVSLTAGATGSLSLVFQATAAVAYLGVQVSGATGAGAYANFDNISVRRLIPREDL